MRGTPNLKADYLPVPGIIPAYAGNTDNPTVQSASGRDHPRVCGEHFLADKIITTKTQIWNELGIIPAYAGNTYENGCTVVKYRDHPRVCGEHAVQGRRVRLMGGSSPRMRGTPGRSHVSVRMAGIIPAYAGNTCRPLPYSTPSRDHPRVCGEHVRTSFLGAWIRGSSPRMRGTHDGVKYTSYGLGIIPAYAGNTIPCYRSAGANRDHPRVCGEHLCW